MNKPGRAGAGKPKKKGPQVGTGGHGRRALEGKGPTPKAEDRSWHVAGKRKAAKERLEAARAKSGRGGSEAPARRTASTSRSTRSRGAEERRRRDGDRS